ncbi:hypothetical protein BH23BAC1_BH23BAC1_36230 [soil metagenome]
MKKNNIDKLFQNKLLGKETLPPPQAWLKLENKLHHKRKKFILIRYAAAITLLVLTTIGVWISKSEIIYSGDHSDNSNQVQNLAQDVPFQKETEIIVDSVKSGKSEENLLVTIEPKVEKKKIKPLKELKKELTVSFTSDQSIKALTATESPVIHMDIPLVVSDEIITESKEVVKRTEETNIYPKVTITFVRGASSVTNDLALVKNVKEPADQDSKLKKLIQSAKDLKLSDVNLAEIRETKDELFNLKPKL